MKNHYWLNRNRLLSLQRCTTALLLVLSVFVISASASSAAAAAQTYHGTLTGGDFFCNGELLVPPPYSVTGTWNLTIDPQTPAQLTLDVFINGRHDVAFGNNALILISHINRVYVFSAFGGFAIATLDTRVTPARFSWHVEFGISCPDQNPFNSLTFSGEATRGGG